MRKLKLFDLSIALTVTLSLVSFVYGEVSIRSNKCNSNTIEDLYSLIYAPLVPFEPPASIIDDDGNVTASEDELFSLRRRHFYDQLKGQNPVSIDLQTYATLTKELPGGLEDFEPVLKILLPDCQPVSLFRGVPVSATSADFETILKTAEIGLRSEIAAIVDYARSSIEPNPIRFETILEILKNDLAITPVIFISEFKSLSYAILYS